MEKGDTSDAETSLVLTTTKSGFVKPLVLSWQLNEALDGYDFRSVAFCLLILVLKPKWL